MQLISLWVKDFKNLKDFTINFENQENLSIIIGNNGSGKSNILEAISAIFAELYGTVSHIHNYKLQYKINGHFVEIKKNTEEVPFILGNQSSGQVLRLPKIEFKVDTVKRSHEYLINNNLFPTKIVALYSGEDTHLYNDYYKPFTVSYLRKISKSLYSQTNMIYMDKRYWGISLFALILKANEGDKTANEFLKKELNIKNILDVYMEFDTNKMKKVKYNTPLDILLKIINPEKKALLSMSIEFFLPIISKQYEIENLFNILSQGILTGAIKDFSFVYNKDNIQSEQMSEGEKKKMLVKVALDIVGTENSLILMDEPDAHLHVIAKQYLYNLAKEATQFHRCVIIATHSPTLTNCAEDKHIVMLARNREDQCEIISENSKNCISKLTGGLWTAIEQNIFLNSSRPLILFEGMDDVIYIKQAINYFYKEYPLDVDRALLECMKIKVIKGKTKGIVF